jgi:hypothetical protein
LTTHYADTSVTISGDLIYHVRKFYQSSLEEVARHYPDSEALQIRLVRHKSASSPPPASFPVERGYETAAAIPGYILAVAAVEAFLNEAFLSAFASQLGAAIPMKDRKRLERRPLAAKLIELSAAVFGKSLAPDQQPYKDMALVIGLRHELVHYRMEQTPPDVVKELTRRGLAAKTIPPDREDGGILPWAARVSTSEGLRWAYNTVCATVTAIIDLAPPQQGSTWLAYKYNFWQISDDTARVWLLEAVQAHQAMLRQLTEKPRED